MMAQDIEQAQVAKHVCLKALPVWFEIASLLVCLDGVSMVWATSGTIYGNLVASGTICGHLGPSGSIGLGTSGGIWDHLEPSGAI